MTNATPHTDPTARREDEDGLNSLVGLTDSEIHDIETSLHEDDTTATRAALVALDAADTAELLHKVNEEDREKLLSEHAAAIDPVVFSELAPELRKNVLENMPATEVAALISALESDDALDIIEDLSPDFQQEIIRKLSAKTRLTLEEGLTFPEDSAGRMMSRDFVAVPEFWTVGKTIDYLREAASELPSEFFDIFVIAPTYRILGEVPLGQLIRFPRATRLADLARAELHEIPALMDQEEVAEIFRRENLTSAPVIDEDSRLIGVITIDDIVDVIDEEAHEDIMKMAGLEDGDLYRATFDTTKSRFKWLFVNLLTAVAASIVISLFDATIQQIVALAVLMPIVASMGGNAGTQALTIAVRALATREISGANALRIIGKETLVGTLNGAAFAVITGLMAALWFGTPLLGVVIAAAMIINLVVAGMAGAGIPILLYRLGADPALSSTVFLTTITDVIGFFAFLGLAALFLV